MTSPRRFLEKMIHTESIENIKDDVFVEATKTVLRRRKSLPSFRRVNNGTYSTLPIRRNKYNSDSKLPEVENSTLENKPRKTSESVTLTRKPSLRKAKVYI